MSGSSPQSPPEDDKADTILRGAKTLGGGAVAIVFAVVIQKVSAEYTNVSIVSLPLYVVGGLMVLIGLFLLVAGLASGKN